MLMLMLGAHARTHWMFHGWVVDDTGCGCSCGEREAMPSHAWRVQWTLDLRRQAKVRLGQVGEGRKKGQPGQAQTRRASSLIDQ